ncbi:hypothetical protein [Mycobacteroides abscessus]|uniref:hypothetical protein n=1 Tax=Mycobacteroides abscessus TaxID=36809 RepID=UPI00026834EB|nr:hypothetical protein [Mycobacteroides abscessus]EIT90574.1 hypothetical protein MA4S0303_4379 [Mycobacteroides abscessus 4S-0303]EIT92573.1 hypothetical protein MA4S0726RB_3909 [Mycobacteroides abscessus 4S-0726-RB]EIV48551.1 hypothetical protein MA4S0116R_4346 [Mycobacteroides abscessus 4S-0116-R]EIV60553.1 hypothetical protein MA4S0116S_3455 [Mycobacteroides abscessus 4S-0116-S]
MNRRLRHRDLSLAWAYAANVTLHGETAKLNVDSVVEPHMVAQPKTFRDLYSNLLLEELHADRVRIKRLRARVSRALERSRDCEFESIWATADELCERALEIIDGAGAADDEAARRRLLAGTKHLNDSVLLGQFVPGLQQEINDDLLHELEAIETG